ncbi:unnamed protein product [Rotaria magnacalcarata]|uniref:Ferritin n=2 Tax=Rotaria magnacalcarata TaxID=392030 RepID=A0A819Z893_9BILA|nr:unnamed protein product [Rotaria magnacalcarata]
MERKNETQQPDTQSGFITPNQPSKNLVRFNYHLDNESLINRQINLELHASYVYMTMAHYFNRPNVALKGHHDFFQKMSKEEHEHANKFMEYQNKRGVNKETMYSSPMQQQGSPMQRPPTMMNPIPQPNTTVGVPSMRPMVASSPMQGSMMVRPAVGSSYATNNRTLVYDKNKRPPDLRPQQMMQPGQQPPMAYGNTMGSNQAMMPNAVAMGGTGPVKQQKKRKRLTEKVIHKQIRSLVPESQAYIELLRLEQKLDNVLLKKRLDLQEVLKRPQKAKKKLRIFISHQYPVRMDADPMSMDDDQAQYWEMRVEGRLLDDPNATKVDQGKSKRKFSSFFRSLVIELDKDLYGPDNHLVENTHELEELDRKVLQHIDSINQLKQSREFYLSFADDPQGFICKWLASQSRDVKMLTDSPIGNTEEERRADYYMEQWSYEAVSRYFYNKVQQKRVELEQALGIRNS